METADRSLVFGPVPSRRLGRSLGVDLVPYKTCSYDCTYCQLGRTTCKTVRRAEYVPTDRVLADLREAVESGPAPDYITLSGSGEPTLHSGLEDVIAGIRSISDVPVAVLTNGSLLWDPAVAEAVSRADLVLPSLDAGDAETFQAVNRPHPGISFPHMVQGLIDFRQRYGGQIWLEVFLLAGITSSPVQVAKIAALAARIEPDRVQINTIARPPAEPDARGVSLEELYVLAELFTGTVEVVADHPLPAASALGETGADRVLDLLRRRPCTLDDIAAGLAMHRNEVLKYTDRLVREGAIAMREVGGKTFFAATAKAPDAA
ncbi:MAG: radical SAM protein [Armatimonadetes bacterium]|nr:radical SAM protein [Armatimonadota bacterium]